MVDEPAGGVSTAAAENEAATKIQAGYRGLLGRRRTSKIRRSRVGTAAENEAATKIQSGYRGLLGRRRTSKIRRSRVGTAAPPGTHPTGAAVRDAVAVPTVTERQPSNRRRVSAIKTSAILAAGGQEEIQRLHPALVRDHTVFLPAEIRQREGEFSVELRMVQLPKLYPGVHLDLASAAP